MLASVLGTFVSLQSASPLSTPGRVVLVLAAFLPLLRKYQGQLPHGQSWAMDDAGRSSPSSQHAHAQRPGAWEEAKSRSIMGTQVACTSTSHKGLEDGIGV